MQHGKSPLYAHPLIKGTRNIGTSVPMRVFAVVSGRILSAHLSRISKYSAVHVAILEHTQPRRAAGSFG